MTAAKRPSPPWHEMAASMLGNQTDAAISRALGVTARQVGYLRQQRQQPAASAARWDAPTLRQLGAVPDATLAKQLGVSVSAVSKRRRAQEPQAERRGMPEQARADLGVLTDMEVALKYGRSFATARLWRVGQGLPVVLARRAWTSKEVRQLGTMPDAELSRLIARRPRDVTYKRQQLGIAAFTG